MANRMILNNECEASSSRGDVPQPINDVAKPIGDVVKISREGNQLKKHYQTFELNGDTYKLRDFVLVNPESQGRSLKPYVAIIKDIYETESNKIMLKAQWFYRPEDVPPRKGKDMDSVHTRELFFSFHSDEVPAESVIRKCQVHFITKESPIPSRKQCPGFIVQKWYNSHNDRLSMITDDSFLPHTQQEIDRLVQETMRRLNTLPGNESIDHASNHEDV